MKRRKRTRTAREKGITYTMSLFITVLLVSSFVLYIYSPAIPNEAANLTENILLGENENYSVYMKKTVDEERPSNTGNITVYDKSRDTYIEIEGEVTVFASTIVLNDSTGEYVLLSNGSGVARNIIPLSLSQRRVAGKEFCAVNNEILFYESFVIYATCDTFENRPWGAGEAPSITSIDLITGTETMIAESDGMRQYSPLSVTGNTLQYQELFVLNENDWEDDEKHSIRIKTFELASL